MDYPESAAQNMVSTMKERGVSYYYDELIATWQWSNDGPTALPKGWSLFEGVEHYDCCGFDGIDWILEINDDQDASMFFAVTAQGGLIQCCGVSPSLKKLKKMVPEPFEVIEWARKRQPQ